MPQKVSCKDSTARGMRVARRYTISGSLIVDGRNRSWSTYRFRRYAPSACELLLPWSVSSPRLQIPSISPRGPDTSTGLSSEPNVSRCRLQCEGLQLEELVFIVTLTSCFAAEQYGQKAARPAFSKRAEVGARSPWRKRIWTCSSFRLLGYSFRSCFSE
jgi:hypothetical protein